MRVPIGIADDSPNESDATSEGARFEATVAIPGRRSALKASRGLSVGLETGSRMGLHLMLQPAGHEALFCGISSI